MNTPTQTRREFLRSTARNVVFGAIGLLGFVLLRRRQDCTNRGGCGGCQLYTGCELPWRVAKR